MDRGRQKKIKGREPMIREKIETTVAGVQSVLSRSNDLDTAEKNAILDATCAMAYYWCVQRAAVRALSDYMKELCPEEYKAFLASYKRSRTYNETFKKEMDREWPYVETY